VTDLPFEKWHGCRNDYLLIEAHVLGDRLPGRLARDLCSRRTGVGADGMLLLHAGTDGVVEFRIFNADGSEAELCGNGLRCAAAWAADQSDREEVCLKSMVATHAAAARKSGSCEWVVDMTLAEVRLGSVEGCVIGGRPREVHVAEVGNPHAVVFSASMPDQRAISDVVEVLGSTDRNVHLVYVSGPARLSMQTIERGVGAVEACATGAAAAAVVAVRSGACDGSRIRVKMPGGELDLDVPGSNGPVRMTGPAVRICRGIWSTEAAHHVST